VEKLDRVLAGKEASHWCMVMLAGVKHRKHLTAGRVRAVGAKILKIMRLIVTVAGA
jgi:hypothetical protein